jgi:putative transposase
MARAFRPCKAVLLYFRQWRLDGIWVRLHTALREAVRERAGRSAQPHAAICQIRCQKALRFTSITLGE